MGPMATVSASFLLSDHVWFFFVECGNVDVLNLRPS